MELRLGRWEDVLADVECDALIVDPPYGERTHTGHNNGVRNSRMMSNAGRRELSYAMWTPEDVRAFVDHWAPLTRGWFCAFSCDALIPVWRRAFRAAGRVDFAPIPCVIRGMTVRLAGDGPSSWAIYLNVARPKGRRWSTWGTLPGAYITTRGAAHIGGKSLQLMSAIVRDYSRPGDLVCDPCAGFATTAIAADSLARRFVGAEVDPETHAAATGRLTLPRQQDLFVCSDTR